jgi:translation elongation factor aEF-1 beta
MGSNAIVTFEVMPESPESDFEGIKTKAEAIAKEHGAKGEMISKIEPLAFGLQKVIIMAMYEMNDDMDFDSISGAMAKIEGVSNASVAKMDLAMG